jgi:hypothetical protein
MARGLRIVVVATIGMFACIGWAIQEKQTEPNKKELPLGSVSGRAYLVTKGGDLKPVRDGAVYLIQNQPTQKLSLADQANRIFPDMLKAVQESGRTTSLPCVELASYQKALELVMRDHKGRMGSTNEEGEFEIPAIPAGLYDLVVVGHAGIYDAVWYMSIMVIGDKHSVKLNDPRPACRSLQ